MSKEEFPSEKNLEQKEKTSEPKAKKEADKGEEKKQEKNKQDQKLAKELAKEGVQEIIPDFKELINQQIKSEIAKIDLSQMFWESYGWKSTGNKVLVEVLNNNKKELDAKIKEILKSIS